MFSFLKTAKPVVILAGIAAIALVGFSLFQVFKNVPLFAPAAPSVSVKTSPKLIGLLYQRQQVEAIAGVKQGLKDLGYTNVTYDEALVTPGPTQQADQEAAVKRFENEKVDLIFAGLEIQAITAIQVTKDTNSNIPIVFLSNFHDPVQYGLINSYTSSGNNSTGIALNLVEVIQKQLEFLKEVNPNIKKIGTFGQGFLVPAVGAEFYADLKVQAPRFGFQVVEYKTTAAPPDAEKAFNAVAAQIKPGDIDAIYHIAGHYYDTQEIGESTLANRLRVPMVAPLEDLPNGGHFGYSADFTAAGKQATIMMDKIFYGAKPADIPVESPKENILRIYLLRAQKAGITFPASMLSIADIVNK